MPTSGCQHWTLAFLQRGSEMLDAMTHPIFYCNRRLGEVLMSESVVSKIISERLHLGTTRWQR